MLWYSKITSDLTQIPAFITFYESEIINARKDIKIFGNIETNLKELPGIIEQRFSQLQEIEAVLNYLNIQLNKIRKKHFQKYLEKYNKALSSRDAEKYTDGEDEVIDFQTIINDVALVRNKWLGIIKALESKNFNLGHISKLRVAGIEDAML